MGDSQAVNVENALRHLREFATMVKVLGSYGVIA